MEKKNDKTYILNGVEVNEEPNTKARRSNRVISIIAGIAATAVVLTGTAILTMTYTNNNLPEKEEVSITISVDDKENSIIENINTVVLPNGESASLTKDEIASFLGDSDMCCINGIYYSKNTNTLVSISISQEETTYTKPSANIIYVAPEGYVLIGDKCYKEQPEMIDAIATTTNEGEITYVVPEGYVLVGKKAIKKSVYEAAVYPEEKIIYVAPSGYTLVGDKAQKTIRTTIEYLLTEEEYQNQNYDFTTPGEESSNYSVKTVRTKPMSELYEILGIEKTDEKKLTK